MARRAPELLGRPLKPLRIVSCHLGAGASLCAINDGCSIDTTMGFTPLEGLVMATRSGSVDPGMLLWLLERSELSERELANALEHEAGLLGLAGTADMREVLIRAAAGDRRRAGGAGGLPPPVTRWHRCDGRLIAGHGRTRLHGGVGEHAAQIRERATQGLDFLGVAMDVRRNRGLAGEGEISADRASVRTMVIHAREDLEIARQVRAVIRRGAPG